MKVFPFDRRHDHYFQLETGQTWGVSIARRESYLMIPEILLDLPDDLLIEAIRDQSQLLPIARADMALEWTSGNMGCFTRCQVSELLAKQQILEPVIDIDPAYKEAWQELQCAIDGIRSAIEQSRNKPKELPARKSVRSNYDTIFMRLGRAYGFHCLCCQSTRDLEIDHIIPVSKNGTGDFDNLQLLCAVCNHRKRTATIDYRPAVKLEVNYVS